MQYCEMQLNSGKTKYSVRKGNNIAKLWADGTIVPWEFNRTVDAERVARIVEGQLRRVKAGDNLTLFAPMPIVLCELGATTLLMDGQHRIASLMQLQASADSQVAEAANNVEVVVCTEVCASDGELEELFERINTGTPVPAAYYAKKVDQLLTEYTKKLVGQWPHAHSKAERPQRPSFNDRRVKDVMSSNPEFRDAIIDGKITADALAKLTERENEIERNLQAGASASKAIPERCLKGAIKSGFYLGLQKDWPAKIALRAVSNLSDD